MKKHYALIVLSASIIMLSSCAGTDGGVWGTQKPAMPSYEEFNRNRKECKQRAEYICGYPLKKYCPFDAYEKREIAIKNCMHDRGWSDPYNMFSYYK